MSSQSRRTPRDLIYWLSVATIMIGLMIVIAGAVNWFITGKQSELIMTTGALMAAGGGVKNTLSSLVEKIPEYERPEYDHPEEQPPSHSHAQRNQH